MSSLGRDGEFELILEDVTVALRPYGYDTGDGQSCAALFRALAEYAERTSKVGAENPGFSRGPDTLH